MAEFPALPLFTDAYLGDTMHLTTIEHGAYMLLLIIAWRSPGTRLPDNDAMLAKYAQMTRSQWARIAPTIRAFFDADSGFLYQSRLTDEAVRVRQVREKQAAAGLASALKRKGRHATERIAKRERSVDLVATETQPPSPSPSPTVVSDAKASSPDALRPAHVVEAWNEMAERIGLPTVRGLSETRKRKLIARIRDHPIEEWLEALAAIERSKWMHGDNDRGWRADFDFLLQPSSFQKLIEGSYDRRN